MRVDIRTRRGAIAGLRRGFSLRHFFLLFLAIGTGSTTSAFALEGAWRIATRRAHCGREGHRRLRHGQRARRGGHRDYLVRDAVGFLLEHVAGSVHRQFGLERPAFFEFRVLAPRAFSAAGALSLYDDGRR
jgi:hypothetical protein